MMFVRRLFFFCVFSQTSFEKLELEILLTKIVLFGRYVLRVKNLHDDYSFLLRCDVIDVSLFERRLSYKNGSTISELDSGVNSLRKNDRCRFWLSGPFWLSETDNSVRT